jgi:hypothetical protein
VEGSRQPFSMPVSPASIARQIAAFERAVTSSVAAAGPDEPASVAARARLGRAYACGGRLDDAVRVLAENVSASDHPDAVVARSDLAWACLAQAGRAPVAGATRMADRLSPSRWRRPFRKGETP